MSFQEAYKKVIDKAQRPPPGWYTIDDIMAEFGVAESAAERRVKLMLSAGTIEQKDVILRNAKGHKKHRVIYRVKKS